VKVGLIVLLAYFGLLFLTYYTANKIPKGFIPEQDQGYLLVNVQLPDAASVQRTQKVMETLQRIALGDDATDARGRKKYNGPEPGKGEKRFPGIPGVGNTVSVAGQSFVLNAAGSNFGSCFVVLEPFKKRSGKHEQYDAVIAQELQRQCAAEIPGAIISIFRAPPIQAWATPAASRCRSTSAASWISRNCKRPPTASSPRRARTSACWWCSPATGPTRRSTTWTSTAPSARRWG